MLRGVLLTALTVAALGMDQTMLRKSIIFNKKTPDVFYCPITKPDSASKMYVKARSIDKLCEMKGRPLQDDYKSDCYADVDETEYACKEKYRLMKRIKLANEVASNEIELDLL